jgi:hypothetical protein
MCTCVRVYVLYVLYVTYTRRGEGKTWKEMQQLSTSRCECLSS